MEAEHVDDATKKLNDLASLSTTLLVDDAIAQTAIATNRQIGERSVEEKLKADFKGYSYEEWPIDIFCYPQLTFIDASHNKLRRLPDRIRELTRLKRLALGSNQLTEIPDGIGGLRELTWLDVTHNQVHTVSPELANCVSLTSLGASDCRLSSFPMAICKLPNLRKLGVFNNLISVLPAEIGNLQQLTKLDLSGNALTKLPKEIGRLRSLTWLNLSKNKLVELPDELGRLVNLKELGLSFNHLKRLPNMGALRELTILPVYNNELEEIGDWLVEMTGLNKLDLSFNQLRSIPDGIFAMPALTFINLRRNLLTQVPHVNPKNICERSSTLQSIDLRDNQLSWIPISLISLAMTEFKISGNPFTDKFEPTNPPVASLSLKELAMNSILFNSIDIANSTQLVKYSTRKALKHSRICESCKKQYVPATGFQDLLFIQVGDVGCAPFLTETCSLACLATFSQFLEIEPTPLPPLTTQIRELDMTHSMSVDQL
jgi:Leucine-rich repeat (LRR) protein